MPIGFRISRRYTSELIGNQPYFNPLDKDSGHTVSNSDKTSTQAASNAGSIRSTVGLSTGKWYVEFDFSGNTGLGVGTSLSTITSYPGAGASSFCFFTADGKKYNAGAGTAYGSAPATSIVGMAIDIGADKIWWRDSTGWFASGDPEAGTNAAYTNVTGATMYIMVGAGATAGTKVVTLVDLASYSWAAPSGFTKGWGS